MILEQLRLGSDPSNWSGWEWGVTIIYACYVCWLTFDVAHGQGPQVRAICSFGRVFLSMLDTN